MVWVSIAIVLIGIGAFLFYASYSIRSGIYVKALCKKETHEKVVALTFDDGPDPDYTPKVLDVLKQHQVHATFFCVGSKAEQYPELVERIRSESHLIGNHSYTHAGIFPLFSLEKMVQDMQQSQQILETLTKQKIQLFRPPFGVTNPTLAKAVRQLGYTTIGWNIRSFDTRGESTDKVFRRITQQLEPGSVILLHDRLSNSTDLLVRLLNHLMNHNYKVVRIDELFEL